MTLVAVNAYPERLDGNVVVWLVFSQQDGSVFALTLDPPDLDLLIEALTNASAKAASMTK